MAERCHVCGCALWPLLGDAEHDPGCWHDCCYPPLHDITEVRYA